MKPNYLMRGYCPLIEEFHIRNILGCLEKKQYIFGGIISPLTNPQTITLSSLTGGLITNVPIDPKTGFPSYLILVQKTKTAAVNNTFIYPVGNQSFVLNGDTGATYHVVIMATNPDQPPSKHLQTTKWAQDYCPYCKSVGFKGIVGSFLKDLACFSFKVTTGGGGTATVKFATSTDTTGKHAGNVSTSDFYYETGQQLPSMVTMMADASYQIIITKSTEGGAPVVVVPYPSVIDKDGFMLNGDASQEYDVLVLGQIQF